MVLDLSLDQMSRNPSFHFVSNNCAIVGASVPHLEKQMLAKKIQSKINKKFNSNNIRFAYIFVRFESVTYQRNERFPASRFQLNTVNFN
jgi:hypothetical protein